MTHIVLDIYFRGSALHVYNSINLVNNIKETQVDISMHAFIEIYM